MFFIVHCFSEGYNVDVILAFFSCIIFLFLEACSFMNASLDLQVQQFSARRFHSSRRSMGLNELLGLCKVYSAANKWNKLNMGIIGHYQSAAGPQGFQVA